MDNQKLITNLSDIKTGLSDIMVNIGKIDAGSSKYLLSMYEVSLDMLIEKLKQENATPTTNKET